MRVIMLHCNGPLSRPLRSVAWVAASVVETGIAVTVRYVGGLPLPPSRAQPLASLFG